MAEVPVHLRTDKLPTSISEDEKRDMVETAQRLDSTREIWFISNGGIRGYPFQVYFLPDQDSGRVRVGKYVAFIYRSVPNSPFGQSSYEVVAALLDYGQVGDEPPKEFRPSPQSMPFLIPDGLAVAEVQELVTRVRSVETLAAGRSGSLRVDHELPILDLRRQENDMGEIEIELRTGYMHGALIGHGQVFAFGKENGKWVIKSRSTWKS